MHKSIAEKLSILTKTDIATRASLQSEYLSELCGRATPSEALEISLA